MVKSVQIILAVGCLLAGAFGKVEIIQDGNFILEYDLVNDTLVVTATVRALGWVGVGLSETDTMIRSDLIMGGVNNGTAYIGDFSASGNTRPVPDFEENILTYSASENATHTILHFTRLADTGDEFEDVSLDRATHILWAYNQNSDNTGSGYHGRVDRGSIEL